MQKELQQKQIEVMKQDMQQQQVEVMQEMKQNYEQQTEHKPTGSSPKQKKQRIEDEVLANTSRSTWSKLEKANLRHVPPLQA